MSKIIYNCAVYTRKSTEEGLDQDFNSLDAQREACEAYATSQKAEGWKISPQQYNDGGFSEGNMKRPALTKLIDDIRAGKIHIVVVYKIDRLTRSLADFSKLVDIFDKYGVTFVSVTQSFNTTTSMGRLTLNVLLSFAQFEREVTGERIRDKVAASKKKGMWMGGYPPVGYEWKDKKLCIIESEAEDIRRIFQTYNECGCVKNLLLSLKKSSIKRPQRISEKGRPYGGAEYSRGNLYYILKNPIYIGKIRHGDKVYEGLHKQIISETLFETVQQKLKDKVADNRYSKKRIKSGSILQGLIFDHEGCIYSPTYTLKSGTNKKYTYYISQNLIQYRDHPEGVMARLPAAEIEKAVLSNIQSWAKKRECITESYPNIDIVSLQYLLKQDNVIDASSIPEIIHKVIISKDHIQIYLCAEKFSSFLKSTLKIDLGASSQEIIVIESPFTKRLAGNGAIIINPAQNQDPLDLSTEKLKRVVRGTIWRDEHFSGIAIKEIGRRDGHCEDYVSLCIQQTFELLNFNSY